MTRPCPKCKSENTESDRFLDPDGIERIKLTCDECGATHDRAVDQVVCQLETLARQSPRAAMAAGITDDDMVALVGPDAAVGTTGGTIPMLASLVDGVAETTETDRWGVIADLVQFLSSADQSGFIAEVDRDG